MARQIMAEDYEVIPVGEYPMKITDIADDDGQFGKQFKIKMTVAAGEYKDVSLSYWTPAKLTSGNKLGMLLQACGIEWESGDMVDIDEIKGKIVSGIVIKSQKKTDGSEFNKIEGVRQYKQKAKAKAAPAPPPEPEDVEDEDIFAEE